MLRVTPGLDGPQIVLMLQRKCNVTARGYTILLEMIALVNFIKRQSGGTPINPITLLEERRDHIDAGNDVSKTEEASV